MPLPRPTADLFAPHRSLTLVVALAVVAALAPVQANPRGAPALAVAAAEANGDDSRGPEQANFRTSATDEEDAALPDATCLVQQVAAAAQRNDARPRPVAAVQLRRPQFVRAAHLPDHGLKLLALGTNVRRLL